MHLTADSIELVEDGVDETILTLSTQRIIRSQCSDEQVYEYYTSFHAYHPYQFQNETAATY